MFKKQVNKLLILIPIVIAIGYFVNKKQMNKKQILEKLKIDEEYYGEFGNQYLSNSHVGRLLRDPLNVFKPSKPSPAFLIGGYFHTCILEPDKLEKYKVVKSTNRNTKANTSTDTITG